MQWLMICFCVKCTWNANRVEHILIVVLLKQIRVIDNTDTRQVGWFRSLEFLQFFFDCFDERRGNIAGPAHYFRLFNSYLFAWRRAFGPTRRRCFSARFVLRSASGGGGARQQLASMQPLFSSYQTFPMSFAHMKNGVSLRRKMKWNSEKVLKKKVVPVNEIRGQTMVGYDDGDPFWPISSLFCLYGKCDFLHWLLVS